MKLLDSLQRRFGRFAVPNLALLIVMGQGMVLLMGWISRPQPGQAGLVETWSLQGSQVLEGQWWRLLTFVLVPPGTGILVVFGLYLFLLMGGALEARWRQVLRDPLTRTNSALVRRGHLDHFLQRRFA